MIVFCPGLRREVENRCGPVQNRRGAIGGGGCVSLPTDPDRPAYGKYYASIH